MTTQDYILLHRNDDIRRLALNLGRAEGVDIQHALNQIAGWQTARRKLPSWAENDLISYPPHLSMEQCSSERTARYKANVAERLIKELDNGGKTTLADLTGGFGVDFIFMARAFSVAAYVERQSRLCELARHNFGVLGIRNAEVVCATCEAFLAEMSHATLIFADPARRDQHGARTYSVADCTPDVLAMKEELLDKADYVMLKLSPMLDLTKTVSDFGCSVIEAHIVSVGGECKELLLVLSRHGCGLRRIFCVNDDDIFSYDPREEVSQERPSCVAKEPLSTDEMAVFLTQDGRNCDTGAAVSDGEKSAIASQRPKHFISTNLTFYLHEPNASIMKAGCFALMERTFGVRQISPASHLFISTTPLPHFPGRSFIVKGVTTMNRRQLKVALQGVNQANITARNFPLSVAELRKRLKLKDGGSTYIFATTTATGGHLLLICEKDK